MDGSNNFEFCCGMEEIGGFYGPVKDIKKRIQNHLDALEDDRANISPGNGDFCPGGLIATTTPDQRSAQSALKFHKFRKVFTFTNPGSGNKVTLWAKKLVR